MLTYWETLIATRSNIAVSDSYAALWGKKSQRGYTVETYTGTLPATLQTIERYLESYKIYGNTVQDGTPTPENPIVPSGCGELETTGVHAGQYKLPLTVNDEEYPIYIGESQTTRKIKKLVLTGGEFWVKSGAYQGSFYAPIVTGVLSANYTAYCSHLAFSTLSRYAKGTFCFNGSAIKNCNLWINEFDSNTTVDDFKSYLAAQYAAGTPVTVWYVLAEPENAVVNEPLMKIGDYADTIDSTQSTVRIPTAAGETTISWAGEGLAPSEVEFVYKVKG